MHKRLTFKLAQKEVLNSNSLPSHFIVKGKMVSHLRELAAQTGLEHHTGEALNDAQLKLDILRHERDLTVAKSRLKKRLKKDDSLSEKEIEEHMLEAFPEDALKKISTLVIPPLFHNFTMAVTVCPPTRRRLDPPNLYPTVKALTDGLTDAGWWEDDDFEHLLEVRFRYGGLSPEKGYWLIHLDLEELLDSSGFVTKAEISQ